MDWMMVAKDQRIKRKSITLFLLCAVNIATNYIYIYIMRIYIYILIYIYIYIYEMYSLSLLQVSRCSDSNKEYILVFSTLLLVSYVFISGYPN